MRTLLYINDTICSSLEQLRGIVSSNLIPNTPVYEDLLTLQRDGELAQWLAEGCSKEIELSKKLNDLPVDISNSELVNRIRQIFVDDAQEVRKPHFSTYIELQQIRCKVNETFIDIEKLNPRWYEGVIDVFPELCKVKILFDFKIIKTDNERFVLNLMGINYPITLNGECIGHILTIETNPFVISKATCCTFTIDNTKKTRIELRDNNKLIKAGEIIFTMIRVQGGTFTMGATPEQYGDAKEDEFPPHEVSVDSFYIGKYVVSQELWTAIMGNNPSYFKGADRPVENVCWDDPSHSEYSCQEFICKLNELTGKHFRLPTEAEWEYAARGGNRSIGHKFAGNDNVDKVAWYAYNADCQTQPNVGLMESNELGIYDMSGNVWEWCQDWYGNYCSNSQTNPTGPKDGSYRVIRGGSWASYAESCRISTRGIIAPTNHGNILGFRLVLPITTPSK